MTSIIPPLPDEPQVAPATDPINVTGNYTVPAGTVHYSTSFDRVFNNGGSYPTLTNNGTLWAETTGTYLFLASGYRTSLVNNGTIVLHGDNVVSLVGSPGIVTNTGSIYIITEHGSFGGFDSDSDAEFTNSGLFAVQSLGGDATAIRAHNSAHVLNEAGGRILAEGTTSAVVVEMGNAVDAHPAGLAVVDNRGLMEAHATDPGGISYGIIAPHSSSNYGWDIVTIKNSGTIRADVAIFATFNTTTVTFPVERIFNYAGGVIEGFISLDTGDDTIDNAGTLIGYTDMGEGADFYTGTGRVEGAIDLGWGDDRFVSGGFDDFATGSRGNDLMASGAGQDLLIGGGGNDTLEGQSGNDGLIGEFGNDIIGTSGGDWVEGGTGNDRILLGDFTFAAVHGGLGEDALVMAPGARGFDIGAMTAGGRVSGIEIVELKADQNLAIRYSDLVGLTGGARNLRVDAPASSNVYLAGGWERGADVSIGGATYEQWTLQDAIVRVAEAASVLVGAPPTFGGFDAVAGGPAAPRPGELWLGYTDPRYYVSGYALAEDFIIDAGETFWTDGEAPALTADSIGILQNDGEILSLNSTTERAMGASVRNYTDVINNGLVYVEATGPAMLLHPNRAWGLVLDGFSTLTNNGDIFVYSTNGNVRAVEAEREFTNSGVIQAISDKSEAIGAHLGAGGNFRNTGVIYAEGAKPDFDPLGSSDIAAIGVRFSVGGTIVNDGQIVAVMGAGAVPGARAYGVWSNQSSNSPAGVLTNNGHIEGDVAVKFVAGNGQTFTLTNTGTMIGDVLFADGTDTYNNGGGVTDGLVFGMGGNDTLTGGAEEDRFEGGAGDDLLDGNGGLDLASYTTAAAGVTVDLRLSAAQATGGAGTDTLLEIENLAGSAFGDSLIGNDGANVISGGAGADGLDGLGGFDVLDYRASTSAVSISLAVNGASGGHASGDVFANFEGVYGSAHADFLTGSAGDNLLEGGLGNDWIDGGAGFDTAVFSGEGSAYSLTIEGGVTHVQGPEGSDTLTGIERLQFANGDYALSQYQAPVLLTATFGAGAAAGGWSSQRVFPRTVADVDGDGRPDIVGFGNLGVFVSLTDANGAPQAAYFAMNYFGADPSGGGWSDGRVFPRDLADIDGDGKADLVGFGAAGVYAALATANGGFGQVFLAKGGFGADPSAGGWNDQRVYPRQLADVNGDGMDDIVGFGDGGIHVSLAIGGGSFAEAFLASPGFGAGAGAGGWNNDDVYTRTLADVNGDGRADVVGFGSGGVHVALAGADGHFASPFFAFGGFGAEPGAGGWTNNDLYYRTAADIDGDGLADLVGFGEGGVHVSLALGGGSFAAAYLATPRFGTSPAAGGWTSNDLHPRLLADLDGDGAADIVGFGSAGVEIATIGTEWMLV